MGSVSLIDGHIDSNIGIGSIIKIGEEKMKLIDDITDKCLNHLSDMGCCWRCEYKNRCIRVGEITYSVKRNIGVEL